MHGHVREACTHVAGAYGLAVKNLIDLMCAALEINKKDVEYDYFGLNHFGWFTSIRRKGEEVLPQLREYIKEHEIQQGFLARA